MIIGKTFQRFFSIYAVQMAFNNLVLFIIIIIIIIIMQRLTRHMSVIRWQIAYQF